MGYQVFGATVYSLGPDASLSPRAIHGKGRKLVDQLVVPIHGRMSIAESEGGAARPQESKHELVPGAFAIVPARAHGPRTVRMFTDNERRADVLIVNVGARV
mmetsp:Transcript_26688/g.89346  ORF Transcript_26688/g.89346 Transcript_26688/m.89346 type:complete len:102 (-) Transcript_26688:214-519(-)